MFDLIAVGALTPGAALQAIVLLLPFAFSFALPIGMLTASLLVFSRLSVDQELTAIRAGGISLLAAITPVLLLALVMTGVSATLNMVVAPRCRVAFNELRDTLARQNPTAFIGEGRYVTLGHLTLYAKEVRGNQLRDADLWHDQCRQGRCYPAHAGSGRLGAVGGTGDWHQRVSRGAAVAGSAGASPHQRGLAVGFLSEHLEPIRGFRPGGRMKPKMSLMTYPQLREELAQRREEGVPAGPVLVHLHKQLAFAFACLAFPMVGIPLGIRVHRRETNIGVAIALALLAIYYSFVILGHAFETRSAYHPHLLFWIPNVAFQGIGMFLIWRANRG